MRQALEQLRSEVDRRLDASRDQLRDLMAEFEAGIPEPPTVPEPTPVATGPSEEGLLDEVRDAVAALFGADEQAELMARLVEQSSLFSSRCVLLLPEDAGLRCWASLGFGGAGSVLEGLRLDQPADAVWEGFERGSRVLDAERCRLLTQPVAVADPSEGCLIPLIVRGRVLAVLYADRLASERFSVAALQLLTQAAAQALDLLALEEGGPSPTLLLVAESELSTPTAREEELAAPLTAPQSAIEPPAVEPVQPPTPEPAAPAPVEPSTRVEPPAELPVAEPAASTEVPPPVAEPEPPPVAPEPPPVAPASEEASHGFALVDASGAASGGVSGEWELAPEEQIEPPPLHEEPPDIATRHIPTVGAQEPEPLAAPPEELATQIIRSDDVARITGQPPPPPQATGPDSVPKPPTEAAPPPPVPPVEPPVESPATPPPAASEPPPAPASGGQVMPPEDLQGPGSAFTSSTPVAGEAPAQGPTHDEARRLARLLVSELKLYNEEQIEEGRREGNIYARLKEDIDRSRQMYDERVDASVRSSTDYFRQELVRSLAGGDADVLGL